MKNNTTKRASKIVWRFLKVVYAVVLLLGLGFGWFVWTATTPNPRYNYTVTCDNGKKFDPYSICATHNSSWTAAELECSLNIDKITTSGFDDSQIRKECAYGNAYADAPNVNKNYILISQEKSHVSQIQTTILFMLGYFLIAEILHRTVLYIFLGRKFITLKKK